MKPKIANCGLYSVVALLIKRDTSENMTNKYRVSSNKRIYTAQEINEIMDKYYGLR